MAPRIVMRFTRGTHIEGADLGPTNDASTLPRTLAAAAVVAGAALALALSAPPATAQVQPMGASGCNVNVCIDVDGSGLQVTNWRTTASTSTYRCEYAYFKRNGNVIKVLSDCGSGTLSANWSSPGWFSHGDKLCNTWSGISGQPCVTVYS